MGCSALLLLVGAAPALADSVASTFQVSATVEPGCEFGTISGGVTDLGTIDFGTVSSLGTAIDVTSSTDAGSIVLTCTPGMSLTIAIDYGLNGGSSSSRYLALEGETLAYQLYQDTSHSKLWGSTGDGLAMTISSFPQTTTSYPVYAQLRALDALPSAGTYTDTVTVTLSY